MNVEGRLEIDLYRDATQIRDVTIRSTRPFKAVTVFWGKDVTEVLEILPLLYSVCGTAQAMAAATACEQAMGIEISADQKRARDLLLRAETSREHMFRILLDWPAFTGRESGAAPMGPMSRLGKSLRAALYPRDNPFQLGGGALAVNRPELELCLDDVQQLVQTKILGIDFGVWKTIVDEVALMAWIDHSDSIAAALIKMVVREGWSDFGRSTIAGLPYLDSEALHDCLSAPLADAFVSQPLWRGEYHETTPFTRQHGSQLIGDLRNRHGNGLLPRLIARLHELVVSIDAMRQLANGLEHDVGSGVPTQQSGFGLSQLEAARGRLIHRVEVENARIRRYQIVAPTEWNFHPRGLLKHSLSGREAGDKDSLCQQAMLFVSAIDPCVDYRIRVH